jgi:hypothetical protein
MWSLMAIALAFAVLVAWALAWVTASTGDLVAATAIEYGLIP